MKNKIIQIESCAEGGTNHLTLFALDNEGNIYALNVNYTYNNPIWEVIKSPIEQTEAAEQHAKALLSFTEVK